MTCFRPILIPLIAGALAVPVFAGQRQGRAAGGGGSAARPAPAARTVPQAKKAQAQPQPRQPQGGNGPAVKSAATLPDNPQGRQIFGKLAGMNRADRDKALAGLPAERRERIEQRLQNFDSLPPAQKTRVVLGLGKLENLPPQRQNQVRKSMRDFQDLPEDRKTVVSQEMERMKPMSDEDRRAHMNGEEFRNRYSPAEQQMMSNMSTVLPPQ